MRLPIALTLAAAVLPAQVATAGPCTVTAAGITATRPTGATGAFALRQQAGAAVSGLAAAPAGPGLTVDIDVQVPPAGLQGSHGADLRTVGHGLLELAVHAAGSPGASWSVSVDIGADGTIEHAWTAAGGQEPVHVWFDAPTPIRVQTSGVAVPSTATAEGYAIAVRVGAPTMPAAAIARGGCHPIAASWSPAGDLTIGCGPGPSLLVFGLPAAPWSIGPCTVRLDPVAAVIAGPTLTIPAVPGGIFAAVQSVRPDASGGLSVSDGLYVWTPTP